jgi:transcriptional regulator with XRE-family HTH domain
LEGQELAARHIALRERAGLTQEQEAKMASVSPTTISGIESGKITRPHLKTLLKIARALGVDVGELRESGKVEAPPSQEKLFNNGVPVEERRAPTAAELNAVEKLADFCRQLGEFLDVADRTNMDENLWQMQYAMTRYMAAMTLPYLEREDFIKTLFLVPAAQHIELTRRLEDSAQRVGIALGVAATEDADTDTEDAGADVIDLMAARVEQLAS